MRHNKEEFLEEIYSNSGLTQNTRNSLNNFPSKGTRKRGNTNKAQSQQKEENNKNQRSKQRPNFKK